MIDRQFHDGGSFFSNIKPGLFILLNLFIDFPSLPPTTVSFSTGNKVFILHFQSNSSTKI